LLDGQNECAKIKEELIVKTEQDIKKATAERARNLIIQKTTVDVATIRKEIAINDAKGKA